MGDSEVGKWMRAVRRAKDWTQEQMAEYLQIKRTTYANYEVGISTPPEPLIAKMRSLRAGEPANPLGSPMSLVSHGLRKIRYAGTVPAGEWGDPLDSDELIEVDARYDHPKHFAATVAGDSCEPALLHGDLTIWRHDLAPPAGLIVLAQRKGDHGCTVKQLKTDGDGKPHLHPLNPEYDEPENGDGWGVIARLIYVERTANGAQRMWYSRAGLRPEQLT